MEKNEGIEEESFKKCRKAAGSPNKMKDAVKEEVGIWLKEMEGKLEGFMREMVQEMKNESKLQRKEWDREREEMKKEITQRKSRIQKLKQEKSQVTEMKHKGGESFWNKDKDFWKNLEKWDVIVLLETWIEKKKWEKIRRLLPRGYVWSTQWATRKNKKERAMGGLLMGIRKELADTNDMSRTEKERIIEGRMRVGKAKWKIKRVYVKGNIDRYLENMENWMRIQKWKEHRIREGNVERKKDEEEEISEEEIRIAIKKIKDGKATGVDGIPGEAWKYGGDELRKWVRDFCQTKSGQGTGGLKNGQRV
ncbi:golgin subfamily A member 6-like protein 2 [Pseudomyrmex gracilis]|uniref:golgin subfamily A member 6-like protein 2 n=1 Tax=Pseudomyrmex gracilis TaxID=219809 RepID=UPI0009949462|nr:golgin subfamily A member 6-like protein 2 [Pseudomyrmex gracilis]